MDCSLLVAREGKWTEYILSSPWQYWQCYSCTASAFQRCPAFLIYHFDGKVEIAVWIHVYATSYRYRPSFRSQAWTGTRIFHVLFINTSSNLISMKLIEKILDNSSHFINYGRPELTSIVLGLYLVLLYIFTSIFT